MKHYNQAAVVYDKQYSEEQNAKITVALSSLRLMDKETILDAGCGTGLLLNHIAEHTELIVGIDLSKNLLKHALNKTKTYANVMLIQADADCAPFPEKTFTTAFALTLLQNMPNPDNTLKEIKRVTKQNARIIITGLKKQFSSTTFIQLLENAELEIISVKTDEKLRDFIAFCRKSVRRPLSLVSFSKGH